MAKRAMIFLLMGILFIAYRLMPTQVDSMRSYRANITLTGEIAILESEPTVEYGEGKARLPWSVQAEAYIRSAYLESQRAGLVPRVALLFEDPVRSDESYAFGDMGLYEAASTFKPALALAVERLLEQGKLRLDMIVAYQAEQHADEYGVCCLSAEELEQGATLFSLLGYMLRDSCNVSTNMILGLTGYPVCQELFAAWGMPLSDQGLNLMSPQQCLRIFQELYQRRQEPFCRQILQWLSESGYHQRLDRYLPEGIAAHKFGSYQLYAHDAGIIFSAQPYLLVIYTDQLLDADTLLADLSLLIYQYRELIPETDSPAPATS